MRGQARMSVCDAISGVDAMMDQVPQGRERGTAISTTPLKDPGRRPNSSDELLAITSSLRTRRGAQRRADGAAKRTRKMGRSLLFTWLILRVFAFNRRVDKGPLPCLELASFCSPPLPARVA